MVVAELQDEARKLGITCHIECGDYFAVLKRLLECGNTIKVADFDRTENISQYHRDLVNLYTIFPGQIGCMLMCAATRSPVGSTDIQGFLDFVRSRGDVDCIVKSYFNQGPMISIVISTQPIEYRLPSHTTAHTAHTLLQSGKTYRQVAEEMCVSHGHVGNLIRRHPIVFGPLSPC